MTRSAATPRRLVLLLLAILAALAFPAAAGAMTDTGAPAPSAPAVWSDQADYNPGATVTLSGAGWGAGEAVHVSVNDGDGQTWSYADDMTASDAGEFTDQLTLPTWFVAQYSVTVTGSSGASATTSFTDGNLTFAQATADTTQPTGAWSVSWLRYTDTSCTATRQNGAGTATYTGSTRLAGSEPGIGNGQSAQPTGVTPPTGFTFTYWSSSPDSTTPLTGQDLCRQGPSNATLYAHFRPTIISTSTAVATSGSPSTYGDQVTLTATVTPANGPAATGTVAFTDGAATLCAASALNGSGQATCRTSSLSAVASPHTITATYSGSPTLASSSGTVQQAVNKATLTVTANDAGKTYGDANPSLSAGLSGFVNGEDGSAVSGAASCTTDATAASGAGMYAITCSQGTLAAANYTFAFVNGTLTVDRRALTVTAPSPSRTYGDANPALDASLSRFVNGDTAAAVTGAASCSTAATPASGVGAYAVTCTAGTLAAANYSFGPFVPGSLTVTEAPLTVTADDASRVYGDPNPVLTGTVKGAKNGDDLVDSYTTGADAHSGVGSYVIAAHVDAGPGADLANYDVALVDGTLTVTKAPLTVKADDAARVYGDANPALTGTVDGVKNGDDLVDSYTTGADPSSSVGSYVIAAHVDAGPGADLANYDVTLVDGTLTVTKAPLTVKADDAARVYGDANPALTGTVDGVKNGDDLVDSYTTGADPSSSVGSYVIAAHVDAGPGADLGNYDITLVDGSLTITKAPLTVKADDASKVYGDPNPPFSGSVSGIRNGDDISAAFSSPADETSGVAGSPYPIVPQAVAGPGASLGNYDITPVNGALTVTPAPLTVTAEDTSRTYGDPNPVLTGMVTGVRNGDDLVDSYTTAATAGSGVGSYPIDAHVAAGAGAHLANYDVHLAAGTLTVTRAPLTVTADDKTKVYGDADPALTGTVTGGKNGDVLVDSYSTAADATSTVAGGPYTIVPQIAAGPGASLDNYTVTLVNGSLTVTRAPLTITADNASKILNAPNPVLTGTITGLRNGDAITAGYSTAATAGSPVGAYTITPIAIDSSPSRLDNYRVTLVSGTLTVTYATGTCAGSAGRTVLQPVNADGSSVFKRGSTVPVKFRVCDANGVSIGTPGVVTGSPAAPVLVSKSSGAGGVDESVYSTTPDSSFRWDPSAQQWIYNQATGSLTSGVAYTYRIPLNDGTWITYRFAIK